MVEEINLENHRCINRDHRNLRHAKMFLKQLWYTTYSYKSLPEDSCFPHSNDQLVSLLVSQTTTFTNLKIQKSIWGTAQGWLPYLCLRRLGCDLLEIHHPRKGMKISKMTVFAQPVLVMSSGWHSSVLCYTCFVTHAILQGLSVSSSMVSLADTILTFAKTSIPQYNEALSPTVISRSRCCGIPILQPYAIQIIS